MAEVKERAARFRNLLRDATFKEVTEDFRGKQVAVFLDSSAKIEDIEKAHSIVKALDELERYMQSALDDEAMYDKKHS